MKKGVYWGTMYPILRDLFWGERSYLTYWYAFLISFPFTWRKVFIPSVSGSSFNEYMDVSFYIADMLILASLILIVKHNKNKKSILTTIKLFHVEHTWLLAFTGYLLLTFLWSESKWLWIDGMGSYFRIIGILSIFVFSFKDRNCSTWNNLKVIVWIIALNTVIQSGIGIGQFVNNQSFGLHYLGESNISEFALGVAKVDFENYKQVRAYGTFLHPNILGGYLVISMIIIFTFVTLFRNKLFHVEQCFLFLSLIIAFLALILTFSKAAIVSLAMVIGIYMFHVEHKKYNPMFHVEHWIFIITLGAVLLVFSILGSQQITQSLSERIFLFEISLPKEVEILIGKGLSQSVYLLDMSFSNLNDWQRQPVHNAYFAFFSDIGLIGTFLIFIIFYKYISNVPRGTFMDMCSRKIVPRGTNSLFYLPIIALGLLAILDHYFWDIYAGQILVALSLGWLFIGQSLDIDKKDSIWHKDII